MSTPNRLTDPENEVLQAIVDSEFQNSPNVVNHPVWSISITNERRDRVKALESLVKKGLAGVEQGGNYCWITQAGYYFLQTLWAAKNETPKAEETTCLTMDLEREYDGSELEERVLRNLTDLIHRHNLDVTDLRDIADEAEAAIVTPVDSKIRFFLNSSKKELIVWRKDNGHFQQRYVSIKLSTLA